MIIDPVLDFDPSTGNVSSKSADTVLAKAEDHGYDVAYLLDTHVHADHFSAGHYIRSCHGCPYGISEHVRDVQNSFKPVFNATDLVPDGSVFSCLLKDGERLPLGDLEIEVLHTPGHTPACASFRIGDAVFVGDTLFMPDFGTARADFPGGDAATLYRSIQRLLRLPETTRMFVGHDYLTDTRRTHAWETTVAEQKAHNIHVGGGRSETDFVALRTARDATLPSPKLLMPSLQVNIRAGEMPPEDTDGRAYLRLPISFGSKMG